MDDRYGKVQVGMRLKKMRYILGFTQKEMADKLHWGESNYRKIENGNILLTTDKAQQLNAYFGINLNYLLTGIGENSLGNIHIATDEFSASLANEHKISSLVRLAKYAINEIEKEFNGGI